MSRHPENICFEVHQAGLILGVRIYLLPGCNEMNPKLEMILKELTRAAKERKTRSDVFRHAAKELAKSLPSDQKTLLALGEVLETFRDINLSGGINWSRDFGQNISIVDICSF